MSVGPCIPLVSRREAAATSCRAATSFEQFDGNQSSERKQGEGGEAWKKDRRLAEGLTDTWPLNGANLRAPAVTLLFR